MRTRALPALALCAVALAATWSAAQAPGPPVAPETRQAVAWTAEGLGELPAALARAKESGRRLLIGLSGGPG